MSNLLEPADDGTLRFVEISAITLRDTLGKSKHRVIVEHRSAARETFESAEKSNEQTFSRRSVVELECRQMRLYLDRSGKTKRVDQLPFLELNIPRTGDKNYSVSGHGLEIILKLESRLTESDAIKRRHEIASAAMRDALAAMDTKERMMHFLDAGTTHLSLLIGLGISAAELDGKAKAAIGIIHELFQRTAIMPSVYRSLRETILECNRHFETVIKDARASFTSENARRALDDWIYLVAEASAEIRQVYSRTKLELGLKEFWSPRNERVGALRRRLDEHKTILSQSFLLEMKGDLTEIKAGVGALNTAVSTIQGQESTKEEQALLATLVPPEASLFIGKPACLPGTRETVVDEIRAWVHDSRRLSRLFWLYGVAGCGKSTVAATVCARLEAILAGSFFCKRDHDDRRNPVRLIRSIAFFLAKTNSSFRKALIRELSDPEASVNVDLTSQFEQFVAKPLRALGPSIVSDPAVIVIDALDECEDSEEVSRLLSIAVQLGSWLHLIVTSRSLPGIARSFSKLGSLIKEHDLFTDTAFEDIRKLIQKELEEGGRLGDIKEFIECRIGVLLNKTQGLFIWIETVIRFIATLGETKLDVVDDLLGSESHAQAEGALDDLYRAVIQTASEETQSRSTVKMIIALVRATSMTSPLTAEGLHAFLPSHLNIAFRTFEDILGRMSAVFILSAEGIVVAHTSMLDFIGNEDRCGKECFTPLDEVERIMATGCFEIMDRGTRNARRQMNRPPSGLRFNMCGFDTSYLPNSEVQDSHERIAGNISAELHYSCLRWMDHLRSFLGECSSPGLQAELELDLVNMLAGFLETRRSLFWLELLSLTGNLANGRQILISIMLQSKSPAFGRFTLVASEMRRFVEECLPAISASAPHLYLSLSWIAVESQLSTAWRLDSLGLQFLKNPITQPSRRILSISCPPRVDTFALSPDGTHLASGSRDGFLRLWDLTTGASIHHSQFTTPIDAVAYMSDGSSIF